MIMTSHKRTVHVTSAPAVGAMVALCGFAFGTPARAQNQGLTAAAATSLSDRLPMSVGLTIVTTVIGEPQGEFESIKQVVATTPQTIRFTYTGDRRPDAGNERLQLQRTQSREDLQHARDINTSFAARQPETVSGATTLSVSVDLLRELKSKGMAAAGHVVGEGGKDVKYPVVLRKVETGDVPYPTIVNGSAKALPAIHAKSSPGDVDQVEFYILDDPDNPLWLSWQATIRGGTAFGAHVLKVEGGTGGTQSRVCDEARVDVYGIYFDFNSDVIRVESEPAIREIANVLTTKPACRLGIQGHTDNVGGDVFNLDLSKRRAAAVKGALAERYHIAPDRLSTAGYGASRPKAPNTTSEGRAQNRRVEFVRQ
jgi:outer membrane protein OmpA-like peptidoglycan-associated protein